MLVLFETAGGFALFKVLKEKKVTQVDTLHEEFQTPERASKIVKLKAFQKFRDTHRAVQAIVDLTNSKVSKSLRKFLKKTILNGDSSESLLVCDKKLRSAIQKKLGINCIYGSKYMELIRGIRSQFESLIAGFTEKEQKQMQIGLAHSLSRHTLQFSVDKVDTMVIQAINLLDDIDKEVNNYAMRLKEWYSWHFPELAKIVSDNAVYAKVVNQIGIKTNAKSTSLTDLVPQELEEEIKDAAEISMGTEITKEDITNIRQLCVQVISLSDYRTHLYEYLRNRMQAIAPNLTVLVGELVGARLIAHAGSLVNLSKHPASTIQILGAEKALFKAIRTKHDTPKYGLLYHASLVGQAGTKIKGKISRSLASKCALCIRYDALRDKSEPTIGLEYKEQIERRIRYLENNLTPSMLSNKRIPKYTKPEGEGIYNPITDDTSRIEVKKRRKSSDGQEKTKRTKKHQDKNK